MSAEIVKKRGRPKKVVADPVEVELPEKTKSTTRAKSTKAAASKTAKATNTTSSKANPAETTKNPQAAGSPPPKTAAKSPAPSVQKLESNPSPAIPPSQAPKSPVTPETSKILSKVRELPQKPVSSGKEATKSSRTLPTKTSETFSKSDISPHPSTIKTSPPRSSSKSTPAVKSEVPLKSLNSEIVSNITTRAGARPSSGGNKSLPPNYKPVARRITMAIVAAPIAIVTSYVLYQRCRCSAATVISIC